MDVNLRVLIRGGRGSELCLFCRTGGMDGNGSGSDKVAYFLSRRGAAAGIALGVSLMTSGSGAEDELPMFTRIDEAGAGRDANRA